MDNKKKAFVLEHHSRAITRIAKGKWAGRWKTYVGEPRKGVVRTTEEGLYEFLYDYYGRQVQLNATYSDVFERLMEYRRKQLNRSAKTIQTDWNIYKRFKSPVVDIRLSDITEEQLGEWVRSKVIEISPKPQALRRWLLQMANVFDYGIRTHSCTTNVAVFIDIQNYIKDCDRRKKADEEKEFTDNELQRLTEDAMRHKKNPRAVMLLMAKCTGMRAGELPALLWADVGNDTLHIHRQQLLDNTKKGSWRYHDVEYTKNERTNPNNGRYFPITDELASVLELAKHLPGESDHVFHSASGGIVTKDSYGLFLRRRCELLGIEATNNHAFRMSLNTKLISLGLDASQRALLLGHSVRTNEMNYSLTDKRRVAALVPILKKM